MTTFAYDHSVINDDMFHVPEEEDMGSLNHSYLQLRLGRLLQDAGDFTVLSELSLDISSVKEQFNEKSDFAVPDLTLYPKRKIDFGRDIVKMTDIPLLVVEILSPMQATQPLVDKLAIYFALGVKSCWIVAPFSTTVSVYTAPYKFITYKADDVIVDSQLGIELAGSEIFS